MHTLKKGVSQMHLMHEKNQGRNWTRPQVYKHVEIHLECYERIFK